MSTFASALVWPGALLPAQVPQLVNYQGRVAVGTVNPVNFNGTGSFKFALVNTISAPTPTTTSLWSNNGSSVAGSEPTLAVSLAVTKGLYSVLLGDTTVPGMTLAIPASVWLNADVRLRVWFNDGTNGSQLLTPDQRLAPHGYLPDGSVSSTKLASGLTLAGTTTGTFSGNGAGLTNIPGSALGSTLSLSGTLDLPSPASATVGVITQNGVRLLHTFGHPQNFFAGRNAGNFMMTGEENTGIGYLALTINETGFSNTAIGANTLSKNTGGHENTAVGDFALSQNDTGSGNTAIGYQALRGVKSVGNIAVGHNAGLNLTGGNNICIGHSGYGGESGITRIGAPPYTTDTYLAGVIHGDTTRFGSGTGTTDPPNKPLIIRRANSLDNSAGEVVARTDKLRLERDGTSGGWRIAYEANPGNTTIAFTGLTAAGAPVYFVSTLNSPLTNGTVIVYSNAQNLISIRGTFGDSYEAKEQTEVSLTRYPGDYYWIGTITSTFNQ